MCTLRRRSSAGRASTLGMHVAVRPAATPTRLGSNIAGVPRFTLTGTVAVSMEFSPGPRSSTRTEVRGRLWHFIRQKEHMQSVL